MIYARFVASAMLFAQQPGGGGQPSFLTSMGPAIFAILILAYFMIIRPQQREQAAREQLLKAIKKNDRILTSGGIFGVVTNVQAEMNEVTVRIDEKNDTKIRMQLSSVARVLAGDDVSETGSDKLPDNSK